MLLQALVRAELAAVVLGEVWLLAVAVRTGRLWWWVIRASRRRRARPGRSSP